MYWKIAANDSVTTHEVFAPAGRFVLHRHTDPQGEHLDLRLEADGHLRGWRIDAAELAAGAWATEKPPHPLRWLDDDGEATRIDCGDYAVEEWGRDGGAIVLRGSNGSMRIVMTRARELVACVAQRIADVLHDRNVRPADAPALITDGLEARSRAIHRLCGLGRELDGDAFEETLWRKTLNSLTLGEIHQQLRAFEVRFDQKYPPLPVSHAETEDDAPRAHEAMAIAREL